MKNFLFLAKNLAFAVKVNLMRQKKIPRRASGDKLSFHRLTTLVDILSKETFSERSQQEFFLVHDNE